MAEDTRIYVETDEPCDQCEVYVPTAAFPTTQGRANLCGACLLAGMQTLYQHVLLGFVKGTIAEQKKGTSGG